MVRVFICRSKAASKASAERRSIVGTGDRSERIRTMNFPENRVTDHRIGMTVFGVSDVLAGDKLAPLLDALRARDEQEQIEALCGELAGPD